MVFACIYAEPIRNLVGGAICNHGPEYINVLRLFMAAALLNTVMDSLRCILERHTIYFPYNIITNIYEM